MGQKEEKLYINNLEIENWSEDSGFGADEDTLSLHLPGHNVIDKVNCEKVMIDMDEDDADAMGAIFRGLDSDKLINKRVRVWIQQLGPIPRGN